LEFEECCGVNLAQFALGGAQSAEEDDLGVFFEQFRGTTAEQFFFGCKLLVNF
jgi:hypothetical protein